MEDCLVGCVALAGNEVSESDIGKIAGHPLLPPTLLHERGVTDDPRRGDLCSSDVNIVSLCERSAYLLSMPAG